MFLGKFPGGVLPGGQDPEHAGAGGVRQCRAACGSARPRRRTTLHPFRRPRAARLAGTVPSASAQPPWAPSRGLAGHLELAVSQPAPECLHCWRRLEHGCCQALSACHARQPPGRLSSR